MIDIHNHVFTKVDDGPQSEEETIELLRQAVENGITDIIVTPHHHSGDFLNPARNIIEALDVLNETVKELEIDVRLYPGQEIRINPDLLNELIEGDSITLNHSRYVLIEFSYVDFASYADKLIFDLQMNGFTPIIAHPERCKPLVKNIDLLYKLIDKGAITQVTASSITGSFGNNMKALAIWMIEHNMVHVVASDAHHATLRPFMLSEAYRIIEDELGKSYVDYLKGNARAILHDEVVTVNSPIRTDNKNAFKKKKKRSIWGLF